MTTDQPDPELAAVRGIVYGLAFSLPFWFVVLAVLVLAR